MITADEMLLIGDEVSWFCGLSPNLSECTYIPKYFTMESTVPDVVFTRFFTGRISQQRSLSNRHAGIRSVYVGKQSPKAIQYKYLGKLYWKCSVCPNSLM